MDAPVQYLHPFTEDPDGAFARLRAELAWERRDDTPRHEYFCSDFDKPYTYGRGRGRRTYEPRPYHPDILRIRQQIEGVCRCTFEVCFLNMYEDAHDSLGWHADDSPEMDDARPIVSVSLGAEREIQFRKIVHEPGGDLAKYHQHSSLLLQHGSLCIMREGMQDLWEHRIPRVGHVVGPRISLVFRGYVVPVALVQ